MLRRQDRQPSLPGGVLASTVEIVLTHVVRAATPLGEPLQFSDPLDRRQFSGTLAVASIALLSARGMDMLIFGTLPQDAPAFFVAIMTVILVAPMPALCARRLRDAGLDRRLLLLLLVPIIGWCVMCLILCRPSRGHAVGEDSL